MTEQRARDFLANRPPIKEPISVHFRAETLGGHTWVTVFAGKDADHRAKCGDLRFRNEEWQALRSELAAMPYTGAITVKLSESES